LALAMDRPARLLSLFHSCNDARADASSLTGNAAVDEVLGSLGDEQLWKLLRWCRDWNANARTAVVAQRVLGVLVRAYPAERFASLRGRGGADGKGTVSDVLNALKAYGERHFRRVEELVEESYLLEFTLREMDGLEVRVV